MNDGLDNKSQHTGMYSVGWLPLAGQREIGTPSRASGYGFLPPTGNGNNIYYGMLEKCTNPSDTKCNNA